MRKKRIFSFFLAVVILLSAFPSMALAEGELTATVESITAKSEMFQGDVETVSFKFKIEKDTTSGVIEAGESAIITTNIGEIFNSNWPKTIDIRENETVVAQAIIAADKIEIKFLEKTADTYFTGDVSTGETLEVKNHGATDGNDVIKDLIIGITKPITIKAKSGGGGTDPGNPTPTDPATISGRQMEKGAWSDKYNSRGHIRINVNQRGSIGLFSVSQEDKFPNWLRGFTPLENVIIEDKIPEDGSVIPGTLQIYAIRYNYYTKNNDRDNAQGFKEGAIYPIESGSQWHQIKDTRIVQIKQNDGESYSDFKARIVGQKLSYGIYTDPSTGGDTFVANFGDLSTNGTIKYTDFEPNLITNHEELQKIYGSDGPSGGNVVSFGIDFDVINPSVVGKKELTNTASISPTSENISPTAKYTIDNGSGLGVGGSGTITIKVVDKDERNIVIEGAVFKVQQKTGDSWTDLIINGNSIGGTTNSGGILFIKELPVGDFRLVQTATKEGYSFSNEYEPNKIGADTVGMSPTPTGEFTISSTDKTGYATIVPNTKVATPTTYEVKYDANGGTGEVPTGGSYEKDAEVEVQFTPAPTKEGYTFLGWDENKDSTNPTYKSDGTTSFTMPERAVTLYAIYEENQADKYEVKYDANGGTGEVPTGGSYEKDAEVEVQFTPAPTKEGYTFLGWDENKDSTDPTYKSDGTTSFTMPERAVTLYAIYEENQADKYEVKYDANGGTGEVPTGGSYEKDAEVEVQFTPAPTKEGYTFLGWDENKDSTDPTYKSDGTTSFTMPERAVTLYAIYEENQADKYEVKYDANGGTGEVPTGGSYEKDAEVEVQFTPAPTKEGYTFLGWDENKDSTDPTYKSDGTTSFTMPERAVTLYAIYEADTQVPGEVPYKVEHYQQNANYNGYTLRDTDNKTGIHGNNPVVTPKTYAGFVYDSSKTTYEDNDNSPSSRVLTIAEDGSLVVKLYYNRVFTPLVYTVRYDANGGIGPVPIERAYSPGVTVIVEFVPLPQKSGHNFLGWSENPNANFPTYTINGVDRFIMPSRNVVLYAVYDKKPIIKDEVINHDFFLFEPVELVRPSVDLELNREDHFAYVEGYPEGTFRPGNSIIRGEVTAIFSRLMVERINIDGYYPTNFRDIKPTDWYANVIGFAESKGLVKGYPDNTFRPENAITRAEFAALCARFDNSAIRLSGSSFSDVPTTHWAYESILRAEQLGWVKGYPDKTFRPDEVISREEVVTVINRMLNRKADENYVTINRSSLVQYRDLETTHWSYLDIMEASNGHDYRRIGSRDELWLRLLPKR